MKECPIIKNASKFELVKRIQELNRINKELITENTYLIKDRDYYKKLYFDWRSTIDAGH